MGDVEAGTLVFVESLLKYHPFSIEILTQIRETGSGTLLGG